MNLKENQLLRALEEQGWRNKKTGNGWRTLSPDSHSTANWHSSLFRGKADPRAWKNLRAHLGRCGFIWPDN